MSKIKTMFKDKTKHGKKPVPKKPKPEKEAKGKKDALAVATPTAVETPEVRHAKAVEYDGKIRSIEKDLKGNFVDMGYILIEMETQELFKELENKNGKKFSSFDQWLKDAAPFSRASGYAAKESIKRLMGFIPKDELKEMPRFAVETIAKLPKEKRANPKIRQSAKKDSRKKFEKTVKDEAPEAHVETTANIRVDKSARRVADRAIEVVQWAEGITAVPDALEAIFSHYLQSPCGLEEYQGLSNEEAFLKAHPVDAVDQEEEILGEQAVANG